MRTTKGYHALMLVFLTHSALELYLDITGQQPGEIEPAHRARDSARLIAEVFDSEDRDGKLFEFLYARLEDRLQRKLTACREKKCCNVGVLSSALRHIFVHGHLTANANRMKPERINRARHRILRDRAGILQTTAQSTFEPTLGNPAILFKNSGWPILTWSVDQRNEKPSWALGGSRRLGWLYSPLLSFVVTRPQEDEDEPARPSRLLRHYVPGRDCDSCRLANVS